MNTAARDISLCKFHRVFGKALGVALETTFPLDVEIRPLGEWDGRDLGFVHQGLFNKRVYHPAYTDGDISEKDSGTIDFVPWVDGTEAQFHRLCFRAYVGGKGSPIWIKLARFSEDKVFGFENPKKPFVNLDFFSNRPDGFVPVYAKIKDLGGFTYLVIEAKASDEAISVLARRVAEKDVPEILAKADPES